MGTLATVLAGTKILISKDRYRAEVEGYIEDVDGILRITRIEVKYQLRVPADQAEAAWEAFSSYLHLCPAAQSVKGCIAIKDELIIERTGL